MNNYRIQYDIRNNVATLGFTGTVSYRTLLGSLSELSALRLSECVDIVLDFSEVKNFFIRYRQIINFRHALKTLLPNEAASKIAIVNAPESLWSGAICSSTPLIESDYKKFDLRCFGTDQKSAAYRWLE